TVTTENPGAARLGGSGREGATCPAKKVFRALVTVYGGPDATVPLPPDPPPGYVVRIRVDRIGGFGPWTS
ncbi:MAG TPA: hypothetical protein VF228_25875, partial [Iamia sp.]